MELGGEVERNKRVFLSGEIGAPYGGFMFRSGRDTYGKWETYQRDKWIGFGLNTRLGIGYEDEKMSGSGSFLYENYAPKFLGERANINAYGFSFELGYKF